MQIFCDCGNTFNFDASEGNNINGFEFIVDNEDNLILHCKQCDKAIVMSDPEESED